MYSVVLYNSVLAWLYRRSTGPRTGPRLSLSCGVSKPTHSAVVHHQCESVDTDWGLQSQQLNTAGDQTSSRCVSINTSLV